MAYAHRYFTTASVEAARLACSQVRGHKLRIGKVGAWSCVESDTPELDRALLARLSMAGAEALGLIVHTGADVLQLARATDGNVAGEYFLLEEGGTQEGSMPDGLALDRAASASEVLEQLGAIGVPVLEPLEAVLVHRAGLDVSSRGWVLVAAGSAAIGVDATLHAHPTVISPVAMCTAFSGFLLLLRFRSQFERVGLALLACTFEVGLLFSLAHSALRR